MADCWQTTFPFKLSMPEAFVAIGYILEPCYLCQQASEIVQLFRQIYACSDFHSPGFFLESLFFFSRATDTGVLLQQTMKSHIWIMHSASPSSYKQTDLSHTIFLTAANQAGWMNCMHLACRWTSASNCRSQITFTEDEKKKSTVAQLLSELAWYIVLAPLICTCL